MIQSVEGLHDNVSQQAAEDWLDRMASVAAAAGGRTDATANLNRYDDVYLAFILEQNKGQVRPLKAVLKALAVAYRPLPTEMLAQLAKSAVGQMDNLMHWVSGFETIPGRMGLRAPSIKRFLTGIYEPDDAHGIFVEMYRRESKQSKWRDVTGWQDLPYSDYARRYLATHAYARAIARLLQEKRPVQYSPLTS